MAERRFSIFRIFVALSGRLRRLPARRRFPSLVTLGRLGIFVSPVTIAFELNVVSMFLIDKSLR